MSIETGRERPPEQRIRSDRRFITWIAVAVLALVAGGAGLALLLNRETETASPGGAPPSASAPAQASLPSATPSGPGEAAAFPFQPLWPFAGPADAAAWQQAYRTSGHQPWHLDPAATALAFARDHLGHTDLDRTTSRTVTGFQAWIGVGAARPDGATGTAAVVHLARLGAGGDAPWAVVGTRDSTLSLTTPAYGSAVSSPVTVGGRITGVDESLTVQVRNRQSRLLGRSVGIPAGGDGTPWSAQVAYSAPAGTLLTVAVSTGGHVAAVERFAVTAARATGPTGLADGRHAVRITGVDPAVRRITADVVQIFLGQAAAEAAEQDGAAEVPPPNDVWIRNTSPQLRTLAVVPDAAIIVNVHGAAESGSSAKDVPRTLSQLAAIAHLEDGVFWVTVADGQLVRIAEQYLP
jgi:hypothetical protein